jgi:hypothetical protein
MIHASEFFEVIPPDRKRTNIKGGLSLQEQAHQFPESQRPLSFGEVGIDERGDLLRAFRTAEHNDLNIGGQAFDFSRQIRAAHFWHDVVNDRGIYRVALQQGQSFTATGGGEYAITGCFQDRPADEQNIFRIIYT